MSALAARLEALRHRIDRVSVEPDAIDMPVRRFARPLFRLFGSYRALRAETKALGALLAAIPPGPTTAETLRALVTEPLDEALDELERDVASAEKAVVVHGTLPAGHATWLSRRMRAIARVAVAVGADSRSAATLARGIRPVDVAPPLALENAITVVPAPEPTPKAAAASRLVALQIAAIDHVAEAARAETAVLARRRRLLEAARRLLLDASASLPLDREGVDVRARALAEEIVAIDRVEAAGVDPRVGLVHQARRALADGDRRRLHAALVALEGVAVRSGDGEVASAVDRGLLPIWGERDRHDPALLRASERASGEEAFGAPIAARIEAVATEARARAAETLDKTESRTEHELARMVLDHLTPGATDDTLRVMLTADGLFDVGGTLAPVRIEEIDTVARVVRHPTPEMILVRATEPLDVVGAVIEDPRLVWLSLAAGRLLTRKFVAEEKRTSSRLVRRGEVRIYLLDGSTSMMTDGAARARTRDALLLCELSTLVRRLGEGGARTRITLHYGYFTKYFQGLTRIETADEAIAAIGDVVGTAKRGGTDIQAALLASFALVKEAREKDADLARGQIVLVTDGESEVDEAAVEEARRAAGDIPVGFSVIALGEENRVLRDLVARQRALGERAFYHFVPDATLRSLVAGEATSWLGSLHAPAGSDESTTDLARAAIEDALQELADLEEIRHRDALAAAGGEAGEGELGRRESLRGERRALDRRFARWFGDGREGARNELPPTSDDTPDIEAIRMVLGTVAEVVAELGGRDEARLVDAIDLAERLLREARIAPARYEEIVSQYATRVAPEREAVRRAARPWEAAGPTAST